MIRSTPTSASVAPRQPRAFSLTELLVVIGIIVLLVGILLVALGKVKGKADRTKTEALMNQFVNACTQFQAENGRFPGIIPDNVLLDPANFTGGLPLLSSTENALLDLAGGARVLAPTDTAGSPAEVAFTNYGGFQFNIGGSGWQIKIDPTRIGDGPLVDGKPRSPYFTPGPTDLARAKYPPAVPDPSATNNPHALVPDLVDAWGQPIIYLRQLRERGPLVADFAASPAPQFLFAGTRPYLMSDELGELSQNQGSSILRSAPNPNATLAKLLVHPAIANQARGGLCLISAGQDGIFFSRTDGPGSQSTPVDDIVSAGPNSNPNVVDSYDDVRVFGGA